jgi:thiol-disulfide isomerase/thioredoxin
MLRYWAVALVVLVLAAPAAAQTPKKVEKDVRIEGKLTKDDPLDKARNAASQVHRIRMRAGRVYTIDMVSTEFDSFLRLEDERGTQLDEDDDSGGNLNARIIFNCSRDGEYRVITTAFNPNGVGRYVLTVKTAAGETKDRTSHARLVGKEAPDFTADFAVGGKAIKLSDLKGKVVLVQFWEVRSGDSAATFPKLRDWHKAYKADGLEIVGVTFYNSDFDERLTLDKGTGKVKDRPKASKETDQALLRDFAAHHKLSHLLVALPKDDALKINDIYVVNGLPQFVLIDRSGVVRMIRVGNREATLTELEAEIKKLLADK